MKLKPNNLLLAIYNLKSQLKKQKNIKMPILNQYFLGIVRLNISTNITTKINQKNRQCKQEYIKQINIYIE